MVHKGQSAVDVEADEEQDVFVDCESQNDQSEAGTCSHEECCYHQNLRKITNENNKLITHV